MITFTPCSLARHLKRATVQSLPHYSTSTIGFSKRRATQNRSQFKPNNIEEKKSKSEWWCIDGEMHEIGENVPIRERFVIPRDNLPNRRRKQMREQFMRKTRLVMKEAEHEPWCRKYMELYQELRENWERLYWDEGYSKKLARDHANYDSAEDDDLDFSPYRIKHSYDEKNKEQGFKQSRQGGTWEQVGQIRDTFQYDRETQMRQRALAPVAEHTRSSFHGSESRN